MSGIGKKVARAVEAVVLGSEERKQQELQAEIRKAQQEANQKKS
ncbi:hypothetical protein C8D88_11664 [Lentzea atacamensis]|uniref:Uncharacterized protein n=1 Tax=Lentzea atacamensis TaxID=531938 RepID=A0A316HM75_9PSEU|nr:hypothetical protein [Lentzea atacamensis]PWK81653.1 hypothetical protein C8D88_11664 [Lentzea atacamensis]